MPRSNWKGYISFGLVSIPIILYPIENKEANISFHQIDKRNNARIKYQRINVKTGKEVSWENIIRGYEYDKETLIPVPDDILEKVAGEKSRTINIDKFIDKSEFNFLFLERSYYLLPNEKGKANKGYVILRESLKELDKVAIATVIISTKEYMAAIIPKENALILSLLKYEKEIRKLNEFDFPDENLNFYKITPTELKIAKQLIKSMSGKWHPEKYKNEYQVAINNWVDETVNKIPHASNKAKKPKQAASNVIDFMDLLKKSIAEKNKAIKKKQKHK